MSSNVIQAVTGHRPAALSLLLRPRMVAGMVGLGFLPLLYWHVAGLLERPHYQFLLLLPVALWMLIATLRRDSTTAEKIVSSSQILASVVILIVSVCGLGFATWAWSPWIAAVSGMLAVIGLLLFMGGLRRLVEWFPVWVFCWILIPLPFGMDEDLIVGLRTITTGMTSAVLDQIGILHQSYANVIELPTKPLFIADACSGIQSLYVLLAVALFLAMFQRRSFLHTLLLLCSTFGLVLVENVSRIVSVAVGLGWQMDLSVGLNHTLLGVVLFCVSAVLILTTDQLLLFVLPDSPFHSLRRVTGWMPKRPKSAVVDMPARRASPVLMSLWLMIAVCFPILGVAQLIRMPADIPTFAALFPDDFSLAKLGEEAMPKELSGFTRDSYETIDRVLGDPFGKSSQRWMYRRGDLTVGISLDYPYNGVKDLCECYSLVGWQIGEKQLIDEKSLLDSFGIQNAGGAVAKGGLFRELFGQGYLLFSSFDLKGVSSAVIKEIARGDVDQRAGARLLTFGKREENPGSDNSQTPPYIQVHLLARSFEELTPDMQRELLRLFIEARRILTPQVLKAAGASPSDNQQKGGN